jgi:N12 class adenine-specific DNA methylase
LQYYEAHVYKNLYCPTKLRNVAGLPTAESQRAFDAFIKVRSLLDGGGRVVFATATPVSNTLAEVYVMMKFLQLDVKNADQLKLPRPKIVGDAPQVITIPASPELKKFVKSLVARAEAIKS